MRRCWTRGIAPTASLAYVRVVCLWTECAKLSVGTKHPSQDHGQRARALKAASGAGREKLLEAVMKPRVDKLHEAVEESQAAYLQQAKRDREKRLSSSRKRDDRYAGLNANVVGLMRAHSDDSDDDSDDDESERRRERKKRRKEKKKEKKVHHIALLCS
mmetsp:Transcript_4521/g.15014  ORF Transcript_4521/g.15014 Transcript_4521/m.15014 type:complete len:159 (+) Transcript_4521:89-565(+)